MVVWIKVCILFASFIDADGLEKEVWKGFLQLFQDGWNLAPE